MPTEHLLAGPIRAAQIAWLRQSVCVLAAGQPVDLRFISQHDADAVLAFVEPLGVQTLLLAGIGTSQHCSGYIALSRLADQPEWTVAEQGALVRIGHDIGQAIVHARLFAREQELVEQAGALDARKNDFVSTVSHELRTPLSAIIGHLELLRGEDLGAVTEDQHKSLAAIDRNSQRLTLLISDLLLLSRIEQGAQPANLMPVDLTAITTDAVNLHSPLAEAHQLTITLRGADRSFVISGDAHELERVLNNLLSNAIKFSPPHTTIEVSLTATTGDVEVKVTDEGLGISADDQQQLFTKFFRSTNPTAQAVPGTGLGLTITKLIVEKHGGAIRIHSELGRGTQVAISLPIELRAHRYRAHVSAGATGTASGQADG